MPDGRICPIILAGGTGKRLWPVSRAARPKQFTRLGEDATLLANTVRRLEDAGCAAPIFVTNEAYRWAVAAEADDLGLEGHRILLEPVARNTAAAICAAVEVVARDDPERLVLIAPSDHIVRDVMAFANAVSQGAAAARLDEIVVFGVPPTRVETGYGYIDVGDAMPTGPAPYAGFREKPDRATTEQMVASGRFLWNAGVFLAKARRLQQAFRLLAPDIFGAVEGAVDNLAADLVFQRLGAGYGDAPAEAFDTAIMEHVPGTVVPLDAGWSDVGSWHGVWSEARHDATGCATIGAVNAIGCEDAFLFSDDPNVRVTGLGLKNIAAVATRDAVLVVDLGDTQAVSDAVARLQIDGAPQAEVFLRDDRPWGHFETLAKGPRFQVKSIVVRPGAKLSLQSHEHRSEHWVVVEGTATVTVGAKTTLVTENQSVYIPVGSRHRLANDGRLPLRLIEVQTGPYLEEDDIVRYDDVYQRS